MAGTIIADRIEAASTSQLVIENGVALTPPTVADVNGVAIGTFCRAWVNFNGTGTVAIRNSFNVSSITDNGTGDYTVNFTNAMPDANYVWTGSAQLGTSGNNVWIVGNPSSAAPTTTAIRFKVTQATGFTNIDTDYVDIAIFR